MVCDIIENFTFIVGDGEEELDDEEVAFMQTQQDNGGDVVEDLNEKEEPKGKGYVI